ncbi:MAG: hypothetical protein PHR39_01515 [Actinomycetota bacterium]|nr:hypothetical protein [Actinomycetota bacterium]
MKKTWLILIIVLFIPIILLSTGVVNRGCGVDRTYALAEDLKERTGQDFDYNEWEYEDLQAMEKEIDKEEKEKGKIVWTKKDIEELKKKVLKESGNTDEAEETEIAENTDEQTEETTEAQQAEFLTAIKYNLTSLNIESDPQYEEYGELTIYSGYWGIDTSDPSKCLISIAPTIIEDPSNPGEVIMTNYYADVSLSGPARDHNMDTAGAGLAKSADVSKWTNVAGLNKYEFLEITASEINGRYAGAVHSGGEGDAQKSVMVSWRDFSAKYDDDSISGTITCYCGKCPSDAPFTVEEEIAVTVITFTGEIVN